MRKKFEKALQTANSLHTIKHIVIAILGKSKQFPSQRLGFVSGLISSDGLEHIERNRNILIQHTNVLETTCNFPFFCASDIFTVDLYKRLNRDTIPKEKFIEFWRDILKSRLITDVFMTPRWEKSDGATDEHETAKKLGLTIHYINV